MESFDLRKLYLQLRSVLRRRKRLILLCVGVVLLPVVMYNELAPKVYQASVSVIFEDTTDPLKNDAYNPLRTFQRETYILNRIQEITSRSLAQDVVAALPADLVARFELPDPPPEDFDRTKFLVDQVQESISAESIRKTDVVVIHVSTHDPVLSMQLANLTADVLRDHSLRLKQHEGSGLRSFIEDQVAIVRERLSRAEEQLRRFKEANNITSLELESQEVLKRVTEAEVQYNQVKANRHSVEERLAVIRKKLSQDRQRLVPTATDVTSPALTKLKERLVELQVQYTSLQVQDYSEKHPKMVELKNEIEETKNSLRREALKLVQGDIVVDPLSQIHTYIEESISLEIDLEALKVQEKALKDILSQYETTLKTLPKKELELASLIRNKEVNEKLYLMLMEKREEARISEAEKFENLRVIDRAEKPEGPISPKKVLNLLLGLMMGLFLGFGIAFYLETANMTVRTGEDVEKLTSWQTLAVIPMMETTANGKLSSPEKVISEAGKNGAPEVSLLSYLEPKGMLAEAFRVLRTNFQFLNTDNKFKSILVTSINAGDGKSTVCTNLGIAFTNLGSKVLIIDADLRRPTIHKLLGLEKEPGLTDVLLNHHTIINDLVDEDLQRQFFERAPDLPMWSSIQKLKQHRKNVDSIEENFREFNGASTPDELETTPALQYRNLLRTSLIESVQATEVKNLKILSCGKQVSNPSEILSTVSMKWLIEEVSKKYDIVLIDSPPLLLVPDSMIVSSFVDGVLVVVEAEKSEQNMVLNAKKFLDKTGCEVLGAVLNKVSPKVMYKDQDYYYYG